MRAILMKVFGRRELLLTHVANAQTDRINEMLRFLREEYQADWNDI